MNTVVLFGRLTKDPQVRYTQGENSFAIARFTLAVDRRGRRREGEQNADFISCVAFGKNGEFFEKYAKKGTRFLIRGHIQTGSYDDKDGKKVYTTEVVVEEQDFGDTKNTAAAPAAAPAPATKPEQMSMEEFMQIPEGADDEGLPWNV